MLYFITMDDNKSTITTFLKIVEKELNFSVKILSYNEALNWYSFYNSIVIFCDIERFNKSLLKEAIGLNDRIRNEKPWIVLNNPNEVLGRYKLLKGFHNKGINSFNVHRPPVKDKPIKFPVFLRNELDHKGPISRLINCHEDLQKSLTSIKPKSLQSPFLPMIVEYCAVNNVQGNFHKYGAFFLKDKVIPKHLYFSDQWMIKGDTKHQTPANLISEKKYITENYFEKEISRIFKMARIGYGRIDFAISQKGIEVFEINTNPQIISRADFDSKRPYVIEQFVERFTITLQELYSEYSGIRS